MLNQYLIINIKLLQTLFALYKFIQLDTSLVAQLVLAHREVNYKYLLFQKFADFEIKLF